MGMQRLLLKGWCMKLCKWHNLKATKREVQFILWLITKLALPPIISMGDRVPIVQMLVKQHCRQFCTSMQMMWKLLFMPFTLLWPIETDLKEMSLSIYWGIESMGITKVTSHDLPSQNSTRPLPIIKIPEIFMLKN